jgi:hypothetical protein
VLQFRDCLRKGKERKNRRLKVCYFSPDLFCAGFASDFPAKCKAIRKLFYIIDEIFSKSCSEVERRLVVISHHAKIAFHNP